jgi:hypothetical protein
LQFRRGLALNARTQRNLNQSVSKKLLDVVDSHVIFRADSNLVLRPCGALNSFCGGRSAGTCSTSTYLLRNRATETS